MCVWVARLCVLFGALGVCIFVLGFGFGHSVWFRRKDSAEESAPSGEMFSISIANFWRISYEKRTNRVTHFGVRYVFILFFDTDRPEIAKYIDTSNTFQEKNTIFTKCWVRDINSKQAHTPWGGGHRALETIGKYNVF